MRRCWRDRARLRLDLTEKGLTTARLKEEKTMSRGSHDADSHRVQHAQLIPLEVDMRVTVG